MQAVRERHRLQGCAGPRPPTDPSSLRRILKARLHPIWAGGRAGYVYSIIYNGELLVERSREPVCDAARALLARGITGKLTLLDGKTGKPRLTIDIEKCAKLTVQECSSAGPRFKRWAPLLQKVPLTGHPASPSPEDEVEAA